MKIFKFAFAAYAVSLPAFGGYLIPQSAWGTGSLSILGSISAYSGNGSSCQANYLSGVSTCVVNIASNLPPSFPSFTTGTADGKAVAYTDANGAHVYADAGGSGQSTTTSTAVASFGDTLVNHTSQTFQYQYSFHVDAELDTNSSGRSDFEVDWITGFNQGGATYGQTTQFGGVHNQQFLNFTFLSPLITVAANSTALWRVDMSARAIVSTVQGVTYSQGLPTAKTDASNTVKMTGFQVFDTGGNVVDPTLLTSQNGYDLTGNATTPTPEPGTGLMLAAALSLVVLRQIAFHYAKRNRIFSSES